MNIVLKEYLEAVKKRYPEAEILSPDICTEFYTTSERRYAFSRFKVKDIKISSHIVKYWNNSNRTLDTNDREISLDDRTVNNVKKQGVMIQNYYAEDDDVYTNIFENDIKKIPGIERVFLILAPLSHFKIGYISLKGKKNPFIISEYVAIKVAERSESYVHDAYMKVGMGRYTPSNTFGTFKDFMDEL